MLVSVPTIPRMKGEDSWTVQAQLLKLKEEVDEALQAPKESLVEELGDVLHSAWILVRIMLREAISPAVALDMVIQKNRQRGYYDEVNTGENAREA